MEKRVNFGEKNLSLFAKLSLAQGPHLAYRGCRFEEATHVSIELACFVLTSIFESVAWTTKRKE